MCVQYSMCIHATDISDHKCCEYGFFNHQKKFKLSEKRNASLYIPVAGWKRSALGAENNQSAFFRPRTSMHSCERQRNIFQMEEEKTDGWIFWSGCVWEKERKNILKGNKTRMNLSAYADSSPLRILWQTRHKPNFTETTIFCLKYISHFG